MILRQNELSDVSWQCTEERVAQDTYLTDDQFAVSAALFMFIDNKGKIYQTDLKNPRFKIKVEMITGWMRRNPWLKQIAPICSHWLTSSPASLWSSCPGQGLGK